MSRKKIEIEITDSESEFDVNFELKENKRM